jgi:hypothetical protein
LVGGSSSVSELLAHDGRGNAPRPAGVERSEAFRDLNDEFVRLKAAATPEEWQRLKPWFGAYRRAYKEEDVRLGRRLPGIGASVALHQIMWARWFEIAVLHELEARSAYQPLLVERDALALVSEYRSALVAVTACAYTIEGLYADIKYLVRPLKKKDNRHKALAHLFCSAFGLDPSRNNQPFEGLQGLFERRDDAVHPYTESTQAVPHPAGFNTSIEHRAFNAVTSQRAST